MTYHLPEDAIEVARIAGAWGVRGSISVVSYSADADALFHAKCWYLLPPEKKFAPVKPAEKVLLPEQLTVKKVREQGKHIVADVLEVTDRDVAGALKGARIFVRRADFPKPEQDAFYWVDLIGLRVQNLQNEALGTVRELISNGPQSILCVVDEDAEKPVERLVPFVDAHVIDVDLEKRLIRVDWQLDY